MNNRVISILVLVLVVIPLALMFGSWSATDPVMAVGLLAGLLALSSIFVLGKNIWVLIPISYAFKDALAVVPGGIALRDLVTLFVFCSSLSIWVIQRHPWHLKWRAQETILTILGLLLVLAYIRNPVGIAALNSAKVGGRPYFECAMAFLVYLTLSTQRADLKTIRLAGWLSFISGIFHAILTIVSSLLIQVGMVVGRVYVFQGIQNIGTSASNELRGNEVGRITSLKFLIAPLLSGILAVTRTINIFNPLKPIYGIAVAVVILAALLSGFRSQLVWIVAMYCAAAIIRKKKLDILVASVIGFLAVSVMVVGNNTLFELPLPVQRALSILPGDWDDTATENAENSTEWRLEMWEEGLLTDNYITNKFLGDGYGFYRDDLDYQMHLQTKANVTPEEMQEYYMRSGVWHSGPVETIHRLGVLGLIMITIALIINALAAKRVMRMAAGTPYYTVALFFGLSLFVYPFYFFMIYGTVSQALGMMTFNAGMLRMIENSMGQPAED